MSPEPSCPEVREGEEGLAGALQASVLSVWRGRVIVPPLASRVDERFHPPSPVLRNKKL